jgi:MFS family permease
VSIQNGTNAASTHDGSNAEQHRATILSRQRIETMVSQALLRGGDMVSRSKEPILWGNLSPGVVYACASWHAVFAIIIMSAATLKCCAAPAKAEKSMDKDEATHDKDPSEEAPEDNAPSLLVDEHALGPLDLTKLKAFVFVSAFFTTLNCTTFIPDSTGIAENAGGGLILSGFLLGAYGIGGVFGSFIVRSLTHQSIKAAFLFVCICMFVGNATALLSLMYPTALPWDVIVFFSRVCAGMELGLEYTNQSLIIDVLNPARDKGQLAALFSYVRLCQYAGAAMGPALSALCSVIGSTMQLSEAVPTVSFMCVFAVAFAAVITMCFPPVRLPAKSGLDSIVTYNPEEVPPGTIPRSWASFMAFNVITFLRHGMRLAVEAGSMIVFTQTFAFPAVRAAFFTSAVMMVSIPGNLLIGKLIESKVVSLETSFLEQVSLGFQFCASFGLFSFAGGSHFGFVAFICAAGVFYGVNATISNLLQGHYYEAVVFGHPVLNKDKFIMFNTVAIQLGMAAGPIASRALNSWSGVGQDTLAFIVVSNLVWQYICCRVLRS